MRFVVELAGRFDGSHKPADQNITWLFFFQRRAISVIILFIPKGRNMTPELLYNCIFEFSKLIGTIYTFHIGRNGKHIAFNITISVEDFHHLMGLHYLLDYKDRRSRDKIFSDMLTSEEYRKKLSSSKHWTPELTYRVYATTILRNILEDNNTIIRYNPHKLNFFSKIKAEYLLTNKNVLLSESFISDLYLFIDHRNGKPDTMFCKSLFVKRDYDFSLNQEKWTLLYKTKTTPDGYTQVLYQHKNYTPKEILQFTNKNESTP